MSTNKALVWLTAAATSLALSAGAYAQPGKSPNGAPGPEGNPNQPQTEAQPPAKQQSAPNGNAYAYGKDKPKGEPARPPAKSAKPKSKRAPKASTPAPRGNAYGLKKQAPKGGSKPTSKTKSNNGKKAPKATLCHATKSGKNPYVNITISGNALRRAGHTNHHARSWDDIITVAAGEECENGTSPTTATTTQGQPAAAALQAVAGVVQSVLGTGAVLGAQASGGAETPASGVLGAQAEGASAPAAAAETRSANTGSLPFTGLELAFLVIAGMAALLGGLALRRVIAPRA